MKLTDITKCPICGKNISNNKTKKYIICNNCKTKIGITKNKLWYEYNLKIKNKYESNNN